MTTRRQEDQDQDHHAHMRYRLQEANELYQLLQSGEMNIRKLLTWQQDLDWHLARLTHTGHECVLLETGYQFADEIG